ncbi:MAG TPA: MlaD family protein [Candidatus Methanoperedens sp.]|nr:MlaD family protein [Candidatus Methanoperedens sp.]
MRLFSTEAKVGVVVLGALASLAWLTFQIGEFRFREKGYVIEAVFRTVSGLEEDAKVRMAGVLVGSVDRIFLKDGRAHALLRLDDGVVVHEDSVVAVSSIGILSERYVEISTGSPGARVLAPGAVIAGQELTDLDQVMAELARSSETIRTLAVSIEKTFGGDDSQLARLLAGTTGLVDRVSELLEENRRRVGELLAQSAATARDTRALIGAARTLVTETQTLVAENREELRGAITGLRTLAETLNRRADQLAAEATKTAEELRGTLRGGREDFQGLLASLRTAAGSAEGAAAKLTQILAKIDEGRGTLGGLVNDRSTLDRVDAAVDGFGGIAAKITGGEGTLGRLVSDDALVTKLEETADSAKRLLGAGDRMHFSLGYRGEYLGRSDGLKSYVTVKLQPRDDKYYLLEVVDDPAGSRSVKTTTSRIDRPDGGYTLVEHTEVVDENQLAFSLQFARDFGPLTFRGGLVESQGGAGLDYRAFGNRLRLSLDGWDFGRDEGPHLKFSGSMKLYKDFYLNAGVDDWSEGDRRSVFVGAGILFSDEDLRELLSLARFSQ